MPLKPDPASDVIRSAAEVRKLFPWLATDRVRGIPHLISPAWAEDKSRFDPEFYAESWREIGFDSVTLLTVHHDGYYLYPSKHTRSVPERDFFGEQVESCRKRDIRVIAYYSLTLNSLAGSEHPEWRVRDAQGRVLLPDHSRFFHYHWLCVNSPFREFAIAQMMEICGRYDVDALWLDILYYPPHPEASGVERGEDTCFCDDCHQAYSRWYQGEHLIDAMGTPRHDEFRAESFRRFLIDLKRSLAGLPRPIALTFNGAGRQRLPYYERVDELADWYCSEAHRKSARSAYSRMFAGREKPFELMSCSELVWSHNVSKPTPLLKIEAAATLACGGTYTLGINHAPDGRLLPGNISRLPQWGAWCREFVENTGGGMPVAEVVVQATAQQISSGKVAGLVSMLENGRFLFGFPSGAQDLGEEKLRIVPEGKVSQEEFRRIEGFLARGGAVLALGPIFPGSPLLDLAGITCYPADGSDCLYLQTDNEILRSGLLCDDPVFFENVDASRLRASDADVLAWLVPPFLPKTRLTSIQIAPNFPARREQAEWTPGIVLRRVGRGVIAFSALDLTQKSGGMHGNPWPQVLFSNLVRFLLGGTVLELDGLGAVELLVTRREKEITLHLFNQAFDGLGFPDGEKEDMTFGPMEIVVHPERLGLRVLGPLSLPPGVRFESRSGGAFALVFERLGLMASVTFPLAPAPAGTVVPDRQAGVVG